MKLYRSLVIGKGTNVEEKDIKLKKNPKVKLEGSRIVGYRFKINGQRSNVKGKDQM